MLPDRLGHYDLQAKIAEGGFGAIYRGVDPRLNRTVAVKVLHAQHVSEPSRRARFAREARSAARLQHPGIVQIYDVIEESGIFALVMEYVDGAPLDEYLNKERDLSLDEKLELGAEIADALQAAHAHGIVHRDVKPSNILITRDGQVKLTDFGLARLSDRSLTQITGDSHVVGTPAYMSPEQCQGYPASAASDIYSLGIVLYEMFSGNLPFEAENYLALLRHHTDTPPTPLRLLKPSIPAHMEQVVMRCLAKSPDERPASAGELAHALRSLRGTSRSTPVSRTVELPRHTPHPYSPMPYTPTPHSPPPYGPVGHTPAPHTPSPHTPGPHTPPPHTPPPFGLAPHATPQPNGGSEAPPGYNGAGPARRAPGRKLRQAALVAVLVLLGVACGIALSIFLSEPGQRSIASISEVALPRMWTEDPLMAYVRRPDENYTYSLHATLGGRDYSAYVLSMTSQTWHADKVSPPVWRHWLTVIVPNDVRHDRAMLTVAEWERGPDVAPLHAPEILVDIAQTSKSIVAVLQGLPLEATQFHDSPKAYDRAEFAVMSFMRFIETGDQTWPVVFPKVKSVVRAMDTVQSFVAEKINLGAEIKGFVLTGGGDGLATWLTGAVDSRVAGIAPVMFDMLNIGEQIEREVGFHEDLSKYLKPYRDLGLMPMLDAEEGKRLLRIVDPYEYRDKLTMPKLILLNPASPMGIIDSSRLYINDLKGPTYLHYAPNTPVPQGDLLTSSSPEIQNSPGHIGMVNALKVFYHNVLLEQPLPTFTWNIDSTGKFEVETATAPTRARLWWARSPERDFSTDIQGPAWVMQVLQDENEEGRYRGAVPPPESGYLAFYIELVYPSKLAVNYSLTTPITVIDGKAPAPTDLLTARAAPGPHLDLTAR